MRISITATQMEKAKGVRENTPSRAFGLMMAQWQITNSYGDRRRGRWGYNKRPENDPGLGPRINKRTQEGVIM